MLPSVLTSVNSSVSGVLDPPLSCSSTYSTSDDNRVWKEPKGEPREQGFSNPIVIHESTERAKPRSMHSHAYMLRDMHVIHIYTHPSMLICVRVYVSERGMHVVLNMLTYI